MVGAKERMICAFLKVTIESQSIEKAQRKPSLKNLESRYNGKLKTSDSSWKFQKIENEQIKIVREKFYG